MDKEMLEQFQLIIQGMGDMEKRLIQQIDAKIQESETRINLKIENEVSKRIESLFDGYKLVHEKQWELEKKVAELERRIESLEIKAS